MESTHIGAGGGDSLVGGVGRSPAGHPVISLSPSGEVGSSAIADDGVDRSVARHPAVGLTPQGFTCGGPGGGVSSAANSGGEVGHFAAGHLAIASSLVGGVSSSANTGGGVDHSAARHPAVGCIPQGSTPIGAGSGIYWLMM